VKFDRNGRRVNVETASEGHAAVVPTS
jgi:hypothetical protein